MRKQTMKKLALGILMVAVLGLTACGSKEDASTTAGNATTTEKAKEATTEKPSANGSVSEVQNTKDTESAGQTEQTEQVSQDTDDEVYAGISRSEAAASVRQQAGSGATIQSMEKGSAPDEGSAWVVKVTPVGTADSPTTVTYYVSHYFCYAADGTAPAEAETDSNEVYAGITRDKAIEEVKNQAGSDVRILSADQGKSDTGENAWVVIAMPEGDNAVSSTYYVSEFFCYTIQ